MATPILDQVSQDLAYKLQDPVSAGSSDGVRLSAAERFRYIIRAYRRLLRIILILYPNLAQKMSHDFFDTTSGTSTSGGVISTHAAFSEIYEIYCKEPADENYFRANFVPPEDFLKVFYEQSAFFTPNLNTDLYYWTRRSGNTILLMPSVALNWVSSYRKDTAKLIEDDYPSANIDITLATEYLDLLISLACFEAYLDIGQGDIAKAYKEDATEQIALMANLSKQKEAKDEFKET